MDCRGRGLEAIARMSMKDAGHANVEAGVRHEICCRDVSSGVKMVIGYGGEGRQRETWVSGVTVGNSWWRNKASGGKAGIQFEHILTEASERTGGT